MVFRQSRATGVRKGIRHLRRQLYSTSSYQVLRCSMQTVCEMQPSSDLQVLQMEYDSARFCKEVCHVWPSEFGSHESEHIEQLLLRHVKNQALCFGLRHHHRLVGAFWLARPNDYYVRLPVPYQPNEYVIQNLFIASSHRGLGAAKVLLSTGLKMARNCRQIASALGLVEVTNAASLKTFVSVGFKTIGLFREERRWFKSRALFLGLD